MPQAQVRLHLMATAAVLLPLHLSFRRHGSPPPKVSDNIGSLHRCPRALQRKHTMPGDFGAGDAIHSVRKTF
ncbi:MAG TPA: hypothetical protein VIO59_06305 [Rhodanobacter sp.]